jgi:hypothetical protein
MVGTNYYCCVQMRKLSMLSWSLMSESGHSDLLTRKCLALMDYQACWHCQIIRGLNNARSFSSYGVLSPNSHVYSSLLRSFSSGVVLGFELQQTFYHLNHSFSPVSFLFISRLWASNLWGGYTCALKGPPFLLVHGSRTVHQICKQRYKMKYE